MTKTETWEIELKKELDTAIVNLVVYNDDINTFDHVIESLIKVCKHDPIQAEQCTTIIHYNGKCQVKSGGFKDLVPMCSGLMDRGISACIE